MKKLARDMSNFPTMIKEGYLYVDKTKQISNLFKGGDRYFFLSRPRRFGKSLLLSTLHSLFKGDKELFKDLWIGKQEDFEWREHPVIHLDFSLLSHKNPAELEKSLNYRLDKEALSHGIDISLAYNPKTKLELLVEGLSKKNSVVVLIDEYDKPILDHVHNPEVAYAQREVLKEFYDGFKGLDAYLRCIFITGVSKFSKTSIFSGLNNLVEISYEPEAADIVGYTEEEVEKNFKEFLKDYAAENKVPYADVLPKVKYWYNGYQFSERPLKVYNPYSLTYFLRRKKFRNYWFESGTPSFLIELLKKTPLKLREIESKMFTLSSLGTFGMIDISLEALLFYSGYLTIVEYSKKHDAYRLGYPNEEIRQSFSILESEALIARDHSPEREAFLLT